MFVHLSEYSPRRRQTALGRRARLAVQARGKPAQSARELRPKWAAALRHLPCQALVLRFGPPLPDDVEGEGL
jgi:hypothetical protein